MSVEQVLQNEIKDAKRWIQREKDESTFKRDLKKRIELMICVLENMKNDGTDICEIIESKMIEITKKINKTDSIFEADPLKSELRILDWIFYQVCKDYRKNWEKSLLGYQK